MIDAAFAELLDHGYEHVTMLGIASRAGASKETLYAWFGSREGLFTALVEVGARDSAKRVQAALDGGDDDPRDTLRDYAVGLLTMLTDSRSVALNRAAMASPPLADVLLASGRHRVGPIVEDYLGRLSSTGYLDIDDPAAAFRLLYGLVVQDTQIRVLLGEPPPTTEQLTSHAHDAVDRFLRLTGRP
jgi:AcrR family transcriptional regulator